MPLDPNILADTIGNEHERYGAVGELARADAGTRKIYFCDVEGRELLVIPSGDPISRYVRLFNLDTGREITHVRSAHEATGIFQHFDGRDVAHSVGRILLCPAGMALPTIVDMSKELAD